MRGRWREGGLERGRGTGTRAGMDGGEVFHFARFTSILTIALSLHQPQGLVDILDSFNRVAFTAPALAALAPMPAGLRPVDKEE